MSFVKGRLSLRIGVGFGSIVGLVLLVSGLGYFGLNRTVAGYRKVIRGDLELRSVADGAARNMLQCRRNEKDFLLRRDLKYTDKFAINYSRLEESLARISQLAPPESGSGLKLKADKALADARAYKEAFGKLMQSWQRRGLDHSSGLQGEFRDAVHKLEADLSSDADPRGEVLLLMVRRSEKDYLLRHGQKAADGSYPMRDKYLDKTSKALNALEAWLDAADYPEAERAKAKGLIDNYRRVFLALVAEDDLQNQIIADMRDAIHAVEPAVMAISEEGRQAANLDVEATETAINRLQTLFLTLSGLCLLLGTVMATVISRSITGPLSKAIKDLSQGSGQVEMASDNMSQASQSVATAACRQASSIHELTQVLADLSQSVEANAGEARRTDEISKGAQDQALDGLQAMRRMEDSIARINAAAKETKGIVNTIDEIAFQTNLLALNAAVEAARAGEAGNGFAVVAEEVRNLAHRAAESARETTVMLDQSRARAEDGEKACEDLAGTLKRINENLAAARESAANVRRATEEQSDRVVEIETALSGLQDITQDNAASAEETAASSEEMRAQAVSMFQLVGSLQTLVTGLAVPVESGNSQAGWSEDKADPGPAQVTRQEEPRELLDITAR